MINASIFISQWWKTEQFWYFLISVIFFSAIAIGVKEKVEMLDLSQYIKINWNPWWFSVLGIIICIVLNIVLLKNGRTSELEDTVTNVVPFADLIQLMGSKGNLIQTIINIGLIGLISNLFSIDDSDFEFLGCLGNAAWGISISTVLGWLLAKPITGIINSYSFMDWHIGKILLTILFIAVIIIAVNALTVQMIAAGVFAISTAVIDSDYIGRIGGNKFLDFVENSSKAVGPTIVVSLGVILIFGTIQLISTEVFGD